MSNKKFIYSSFIVSSMTMLSRIFGLIRDIIIAKYFGANASLDAFIVAFKIPNFFRRLFAEGSFSQAIMPILADAKEQQKELEIINHISGRLFSILLILTIIAILFAPIFIFIFAWGFYFAEDNTKFFLASDLLKITFPYLLLISMVALSGSILNTNKKFAVPAFTPVLLNIAMILSAIFLSTHLKQPIFALAYGVFIGGILQLLLQIPFLMKINKLPKLTFKAHKVFTTIKQRMLPALFGSSIAQINLLIDTIIASTLISGSISWLYYANRLLELPIAIIGVALAIVSIAKLSKLFARGDEIGFKKLLNNSINIGIILAIPSAIGLMLLAKPLIITLFQYDKFSNTDVNNSSLALISYSLAVIFFILTKIITAAFLSRGDTKSPVRAGVVSMLSNILLNLILSYYYSFIGLAIATTIAAIINFIILIWYSSKHNIYHLTATFYKLLIKIIIASLVMAAFILYNNNNYLDATAINRIIMLSYEVIISIVIYIALLFLFNVKLKS